MDCNQCVEDLTAFLDGELSAGDSEKVRSHLGACQSCSEEMHSLRETAAFIESHNHRLEPRVGSWNLVRAQILAQQPESRRGFWAQHRWRFGLATIAILAIFALGYVQYQQTEKRNLERYISEYEKERQNRRQLDINARYENNPFIEKVSFVKSPFQTEGSR